MTNNFKGICEYELWNAFLSVVDNLTMIPQVYHFKIKDWREWSKRDLSNFIYMIKGRLRTDNSIWDTIGLPTHWKEEYLYLWISITSSKEKVVPVLRSELQSDLELYND